MSDYMSLGLDKEETGVATNAAFPYERFVDADVAARFLMVKRKTILEWARTGTIPAHRFGRGNRTVWRFRISELASNGDEPKSTMTKGSPEVARLEM